MRVPTHAHYPGAHIGRHAHHGAVPAADAPDPAAREEDGGVRRQDRQQVHDPVAAAILNGAAQELATFVGAIPHGEMADYYRLADMTVSIPSSDGTPMSVLESMACGTPVVVSRIPNYDSHYIEENKTVLMVDPNDPAALATALTRLLQDRLLAQSLALEAERRVRLSGSYESQMAKMNELYMNFNAKP